MDGGQQLAGVVPAGAGGTLAAPLVGVALARQAVVAVPAVGDDAAAGLDGAGYERVQ